MYRRISDAPCRKLFKTTGLRRRIQLQLTSLESWLSLLTSRLCDYLPTEAEDWRNIKIAMFYHIEWAGNCISTKWKFKEVIWVQTISKTNDDKWLTCTYSDSMLSLWCPSPPLTWPLPLLFSAFWMPMEGLSLKYCCSGSGSSHTNPCTFLHNQPIIE